MIKVLYTHRGEPVGFKRPSFNEHTGKFFNPPKYEAYKKELAEALHFSFPGLAGESDGKKRYSLSLLVFRSRDVGDLDNFTKPVKDALQIAGIIRNDKQIVEYREPYKMLIDKIQPRIEFLLEEIDGLS